MDTIGTVVGVDTSKRVFPLYRVEPQAGECKGLKLVRAKCLEPFANRAACLVAMEARGGSQHWARPIPAKKVRAFVDGNNNDARDARGGTMRIEME